MMRKAGETSAFEHRLINVDILKQTLPNLEEALTLLVRFKPTLIEEMNDIERGLAQEDLETVRFHTHRIRSGSLYLGIEGVGMLATQLEELLENQAPLDDIRATWSLLQTACRRFLSYDRAGLETLIRDRVGK